MLHFSLVLWNCIVLIINSYNSVSHLVGAHSLDEDKSLRFIKGLGADLAERMMVLQQLGDSSVQKQKQGGCSSKKYCQVSRFYIILLRCLCPGLVFGFSRAPIANCAEGDGCCKTRISKGTKAKSSIWLEGRHSKRIKTMQLQELTVSKIVLRMLCIWNLLWWLQLC